MIPWLLNLWRRTPQHWWLPTPSSSASSLSSSPPRVREGGKRGESQVRRATQDKKRGHFFCYISGGWGSPGPCGLLPAPGVE